MKSKAIFTSIFFFLTKAFQAESDFPQGNTLEFKKETNDFSKLTQYGLGESEDVSLKRRMMIKK